MNYIYNEFYRLSKEYRIWNRFINTVKYVGIIDTFSDNALFHMNNVIDNIWVSNLPRNRNHQIIRQFDLIISFLDKDEVGLSETAWINDIPHITYHQIPAIDYNPLTISNGNRPPRYYYIVIVGRDAVIAQRVRILYTNTIKPQQKR
jgi:hypothetical protein